MLIIKFKIQIIALQFSKNLLLYFQLIYYQYSDILAILLIFNLNRSIVI